MTDYKVCSECSKKRPIIKFHKNKDRCKYCCASISVFYVHLGDKLLEIRKELGLSLSDVAGDIGVSYQLLQKYERGSVRIPFDMIEEICMVYDVSPEVLFSTGKYSDIDLSLMKKLVGVDEKTRNAIGMLIDGLRIAE